MEDNKDFKGFTSEDVKSSDVNFGGRQSDGNQPRIRRRIVHGERVETSRFNNVENDGNNGYRRYARNDYAGRRNNSNDFRNENRGGSYNRNSSYNNYERKNYGERTEYRSEHYNARDKYQPSRTAYDNNGRREYSPRYNEYAQRSNNNYNREYHSDRYSRAEQFSDGDKSYNRREEGYRPNRNFHRDAEQNGSYNVRNRRPEAGKGDYNPSSKYSQKKILRYKEENIDPTVPIRLNRFLANSGVCSRRDADDLIKSGVVTVNGETVTELGVKVMRTDDVQVKGKTVSIEDKIYVLMNKPKDCVTTAEDPEGRKTVMDLMKGACPERIYPIGRLDRNTTGVLLLTNDGDLAAKLMHPKFEKKKIYHVYLNKSVTEEQMQMLRDGIELDDGAICADAIEYADETDKKQVGIEIHSGRNRIVRRMFEHLGLHVVKLDRVYFAGLTKKNLRRGQWRFLTPDEVNILRMGAFE